MCREAKHGSLRTILFFLLIGLASISAYLGYRNAQIIHQKEAVESGHAEWNAEDGSKEFKWHECSTCVPPKVTK